MIKYKDSAPMPIIAVDFDDTININGSSSYPTCGKVRSWVVPVFNFMNKLGIKIVIWTSRDVAYNQDDGQIYDHMTPMIEFLKDNKIHYDAINKSVQFAPYVYNGRKVYAHMYVDDRAFGWYGTEDGDDNIMLDVLEEFLFRVCKFSRPASKLARTKCKAFKDPDDWMIEAVSTWKVRNEYVGPK